MKKIVLIEDDADLYSLIQYNLEKEGFAISGSQTGNGALDLASRKVGVDPPEERSNDQERQVSECCDRVAVRIARRVPSEDAE